MSVSRASQKQEKATEGPIGASASPATVDLSPDSQIPGVSPSGYALGQTFSIRDSRRPLPRIQTKLRISQPGDFQEEEADRIAERVLREGDPGGATGSEPYPMPGPRSTSSATIQRNCSGCEESEPCVDCEEESRTTQSELHSAQTAGIQRTSQEAGGTPGRAPRITPEFEASMRSLEGRGQPLPDGVRSTLESSFGRDFRDVRIHRGPEANESSRAVGALAYTVGRNIVFAQGQFAPDTAPGRKLLAHELAHVLQQSSTPLGAPRAIGREEGRPNRQVTTDFRASSSGLAASVEPTGTSKVAFSSPYLQRQPAPPAVTPADNKQVQKYIDDALQAKGGNVSEAWRYVQGQRNTEDPDTHKSRCGDVSLAYAEHYLLARMLVGRGLPAALGLALVLAYSAGKVTLQGVTQQVEKFVDAAKMANLNEEDYERLKELVKLLKATHMSVCESAPASTTEVFLGIEGSHRR